MSRLASAIVILVSVLASAAAHAGQRTVTLAVEGMTCAGCAYIVRSVLLRVPGVERAEVSFAEGRAVVTFDDAQADPAALVRASEGVGFPARLAGD